MKLRELKVLLATLPPEADEREVVLGKDAEGNGYSPLANIWPGNYVAENTWSGEAWLEELTPELAKHGYTEEDVSEEGEKALFLMPTN